MSTVTTLPTRHTYTANDLAAMPDDGNRYELIDGVLIVSPAPVPGHQRASFRLGLLLAAACPDDLEIFTAPFEVRLASDTVVQPDLLVTRPESLDRTGLPGAPLLALEILSPSTRLVDLNLKKARYEVGGCPSYWVVDPGLGGAAPSITAWELLDGAYVEVGHAEGGTTLHLDRPFTLEVIPSDLVGPRRRRPGGSRPTAS